MSEKLAERITKPRRTPRDIDRKPVLQLTFDIYSGTLRNDVAGREPQVVATED